MTSQSQPMTPVAAVPVANAFEPGAGETILVVDDDVGVRDLVVGVLVRRKYRVLAANSAAAALEVWAQHGPSVRLLLTDIVMPGGISGSELAERLLALRPALPVLYMSGYNPNPVDREQVRRQGKPLLQKPFTIDQLVKAVRTHLTVTPAA
jgi:two-component system cell cycle sensor histidine kinase/response regulator CckA